MNRMKLNVFLSVMSLIGITVKSKYLLVELDKGKLAKKMRKVGKMRTHYIIYRYFNK